MLVIKNDTDKKRCMSAFGNNEFVLTKDEVWHFLKEKYLEIRISMNMGLLLQWKRRNRT